MIGSVHLSNAHVSHVASSIDIVSSSSTKQKYLVWVKQLKANPGNGVKAKHR